MRYEVNEKIYEVIITRKNNKNTYIRYKQDGKIYVTTSFFVTNHQIKELLDRNQNEIKDMINRIDKQVEKKQTFFYFGEEYQIIVVPSLKNIEINNNYIYIPNEKKLNQWLAKETRMIFEERLSIIYQKWEEKIPYPSLKIRNMTTRWGVCNKKNQTVTLNSQLMRYGLEQIDYVIIHELSHFVHFNHSKEFWNLVFKYCPNYKNIRKSLKEGSL